MIRNILVPIDDSPLADKVLDHAMTLAERFGAHLHVLSVWEARPGPAEEDAVRKRVLDQLGSGHRLPAAYVQIHVGTGQPLSSILHGAEEHAVDLIVMGTHGRRGLSARLFGTTTERVLLDGSTALFVVREDEPEPG